MKISPHSDFLCNKMLFSIKYHLRHVSAVEVSYIDANCMIELERKCSTGGSRAFSCIYSQVNVTLSHFLAGIASIWSACFEMKPL